MLVTPEEFPVVLMLEVCAGEAAELLRVGLKVAAVKAVPAGKVPGVLFSPGTPTIRRNTSTVIPDNQY